MSDLSPLLVNAGAGAATLLLLVYLVRAVTRLVTEIKKHPERRSEDLAIPSPVQSDNSAPLAGIERMAEGALEAHRQVAHTLRLAQELHRWLLDQRDEDGRYRWDNTHLLRQLLKLREEVKELQSAVRGCATAIRETRTRS